MNLKFYKREYYIFKDNRWVNLSKEYGNVNAIKGFLIAYLQNNNKEETQSSANLHATTYINNAMLNSVSVESMYDDEDKAFFLNGYVDIKEQKFYDYLSLNEEVPFTPFLVPRNYVEEVKQNTLAEQFMKKFSDGDDKKYKLLMEIAGSCFFPKNPSVLPILYSKHSTSGKGTFIELIDYSLKSVFSDLAKSIKGEKFFSNNQFGLSVAIGATTVIIDELKEKINLSDADLIKGIVDSKKTLPIERKGVDIATHLNSATWIATTNRKLKIVGLDNGLKRRIIWIPLSLNEESDKTGIWAFTQQFIEKMLVDEDSLNWFTNQAIKHYSETIKNDLSRADKFTKLDKETENIFDEQEYENKAYEVITDSKLLNDYVLGKSDFILNEELRSEHLKWCEKFGQKFYAFEVFKKEFINILEQEHNCLVRNKTFKNQRGIEVEWKE